ncbi:MAG: glycosyltransferase family 39 protein [Anaerolineae bacterium]|nr:glycosyltransferase family 39 protein [Anaerolineae bacterium]
MSTQLTAGKANRPDWTVAAVRVLPYLLVLIAFALRMYRIDYQSIWRDEGVSLHLAASSIPAILTNRASDVHPPLYFILLHFWTGLAGFSELSARFFSLIFGVLLIPALYSVIRNVFGTRTALATTAIAAFSPLYVVYSQEARTYAMLPLLYLFIIYRLYQLARGEELAWRHWIELAVVEVLCLHLHYFSIFAVAYMNLFLAALWLMAIRNQVFGICTQSAHNCGCSLHVGNHRVEKKPGFSRYWLSSQVLAALACLPWAWMVIRSWTAAGSPQPVLAGPTLRMAFLKQASFVWHFSIGGKHLWGHYLFAPLSFLLALAFIVALPLSIRVDHRRRQTLTTCCHLIAPLSMVFILWWWKPLLSPNYIIMFTVPFFILVGRAIVVSIEARGPTKLAGLSLALTLAATFALGLRIAFFDPTYFKDNVRGLVEYLEPLASADDVIIVHPIDYSVEYYYNGDAPIAMIDPDDAQLVASLEEALRGKRMAFLAWPFGTPLDSPGLLPLLLETSGRSAGGELFKGYSLRIYEPERAVSIPKIEPAAADFGDVRLTGAFYQDEVEADDAICLALRWQLARATRRAYKVVVILWDEAGRRLSGADMLLTNRTWGLSTERWTTGQEEINYYIVPVPLGTPPLPYRITVGVYDADTMERLPFLDAAGNPAGEDFPLGEVALTKAHDPSTGSGHGFERDPYGTRRHLSLKTLDEPEIADGLALEGFAISKVKARPQEPISIMLQWRALRDGLPRYLPRLRLRWGDAIWAEVGSTLFEERYPTTEWAEGEVVFEQRDFAYPPRVGQAVLEVEVAGRAVALGEMKLDLAGLAFEAPPMQHQVGVRFGGFAELLGYDLDRTEATTNEKVRLTLYWRAINEEPLTTSCTVFTHLLSEDGRLIGQHDGIPAEGERPTMSWVPGEVIADVHDMEFSDLGYRGRALIEVGLYESLTVERVLTEEGSDHLILPSLVEIRN